MGSSPTKKGHGMPLHRHTMTLNVGGSVRANDPTSQSMLQKNRIFHPDIRESLRSSAKTT
jgi:hypothetical protein